MKKNQLILLSMLSAMATPLAFQPVHATSAVEMRMKALEQQKKESELASKKAQAEAQAAKQKEVAVQNADVQKELNALISDINSNLGGGLTVVATADKDGLTDGVKEVKKALDAAVAEKKAVEADLATLRTDIETLLASIDAKSGKVLPKIADDKPASFSVAIKAADADVKGIVAGGPPVNLAGIKTEIETLLTSLNAKSGKAIANPANDQPATLEATLKLADTDVKTLASAAEMAALKVDVDALLVPINAKSGKAPIANAADDKPATLLATLKLAATDAAAIPVGGGGLPLNFAADVGHVNAELAKVLGAKYNAGTMDFKTNGTGFQASINAFVAALGTLPANFQTIVKPDVGAPATVLGFYGVVEDMVDTIATGKGAMPAKLGGSAATPNSGLGKLKIAMDHHKVKL